MNLYLNHCEQSPLYISSTDYNEHPEPICLAGIRRENHSVFEVLEREPDAVRRSEIFIEFMSVKFQLHEWDKYEFSAGRSLRNHYLKFIRNWGVDSNSPSGAVLKFWVESRIGILPTFHSGCLRDDDIRARYNYRTDVIKGSSQTSAIASQFDLLFEYCQFELKKRSSEEVHLRLYRGTHDPDEYEIIESGPGRNICVRLNNLSSFTSDKERAWEFGSTVWEVRVPIYKVFFFSGLLPDNLLKGEDEYMVIGGDYWVKGMLY